MRMSVLRSSKRRLVHGAAIILVGGLVSGCSSDALRFTYGQDGMFTGATPNQKQIIKPDQPFPGDSQSLDSASTGSINRQAVKPVDLAPKSVTKTELAPVAGTKVAAADSKPLVKLSEQSPALDTTSTGTVPAPAAASTDTAEPEAVGWSKAGGTQVTAKEGETIYNLSRRFGVPANVLMKMNGLSDANGLKVGQKVIIPTYVYSAKAPVSAPDNDPKVANAKSSRGNKTDEPAKLPKPEQPADNVAVLPKAPKLKEGEAAQATETTAATDGKTLAKPEPEKVAKAGTYTVQSGDTLSKVAKKNGVGVAALKEANGLSDGLLKIGQTLKIPAGGQKVASAAPAVDPVITGAAGPAKKADSGEVAGYTPPKKTEKVAEKSIEDADVDTAAAAPDSTGIGKMRWPVKGRVVSSYGKGSGRSNDGIDIAVPEGTPVKAAENGVVIYAGDGLKDFGNTVLVRHENGLVTVYGHADKLMVKRGEKVKRGQEIATSGMTGTTDSPKLHFEVRKESAPVDPSGYLE